MYMTFMFEILSVTTGSTGSRGKISRPSNFSWIPDSDGCINSRMLWEIAVVCVVGMFLANSTSVFSSLPSCAVVVITATVATTIFAVRRKRRREREQIERRNRRRQSGSKSRSRSRRGVDSGEDCSTHGSSRTRSWWWDSRTGKSLR